MAVFCLATYGEGDPTDNAMEFYEWIQNGDHDLTGLNYAVSFFLNLLKFIQCIWLTLQIRPIFLLDISLICGWLDL